MRTLRSGLSILAAGFLSLAPVTHADDRPGRGSRTQPVEVVNPVVVDVPQPLEVDVVTPPEPVEIDTTTPLAVEIVAAPDCSCPTTLYVVTPAIAVVGFTQALYTGDLGGRAGADAKCQAELGDEARMCMFSTAEARDFFVNVNQPDGLLVRCDSFVNKQQLLWSHPTAQRSRPSSSERPRWLLGMRHSSVFRQQQERRRSIAIGGRLRHAEL